MREFAQWLDYVDGEELIAWEIPPAHYSRFVNIWDLEGALTVIARAVAHGKYEDFAQAIEEEYPILTRDEREILLHNIARWYQQWQQEVSHETSHRSVD